MSERDKFDDELGLSFRIGFVYGVCAGVLLAIVALAAGFSVGMGGW